MFKLAFAIASRAGSAARLSTLIHHRVLAQPDPLFPETPTAASFDQQLGWLKRWFNVLPLAAAMRQLREGKLPARALCITFDDGYADNEEVAGPILQRHGLSATFFVSTGFLHGGCMWNDRVIEAIRQAPGPVLHAPDLGLPALRLAALHDRRATIDRVLKHIKHFEPARRHDAVEAIAQLCGGRPSPAMMMSPQQVRRLRERGMDIGGHTVNHPILTRLPAPLALQEIAQGRDTLREILGERIALFAYPNGVPVQDYAAEHVQMVRDCGFEGAVSTAWGAAGAGSHPYQLPRFTPWDRTRTRFGLRMLANLAGKPERRV